MTSLSMRAAWKLVVWISIFLSALLPSAVHAQMDRHIEATLFTETRTPAPGEQVRIAIRMKPEPGWHGYWVNPGDSGLPVTAEWEAPAGVRFGDLRHPAPTLLDIQGIASYVHEGSFTLLTTMVVPRGLAPGVALPIKADLSWLACSDSLCVPERATLTTTLRVGNGAPDARGAEIVGQASSALPAPLSGATYKRVGGQWIVNVPVAPRIDESKARLYPTADGWVAPAAAQKIERSASGLSIAVPALEGLPDGDFSAVVSDGRFAYALKATPVSAGSTAGDAPASGEAKSTGAGELIDVAAGSRPAATLDAATLEEGTSGNIGGPVAANVSYDSGLLMTALLGAIAGGLLLNLMPCVFPILSLKALSLVRSGSDRREARREGLGYAAGSIATATLLGGILVALKAAGQEIGWSFQLQSPAMVLLLLVLTSVIALNLAGLFEFRLPALLTGGSARAGWSGGFATGALAALIATPCSGPFMAGALGAALVLPPAASLAVFAGLGLGMALPFLAIAFVPALQKRLPKPGGWMETLRRILALPMFATALALAWILGRQTGVDGMTIGLAVTLAAAAGLWWFGHRQMKGLRAWPALTPAAAALGMALATGLPLAEPTTASAPRDELHQPFSPQRLAELRAAGSPVFVDFTADWCLTCKVNEKVAIETETVQAAFREAGVVTLTADWTRGDPEITRFLAQHGRNSIPFYLFYEPGEDGQELPQILTPALLEEIALAERQAGGTAS